MKSQTFKEQRPLTTLGYSGNEILSVNSNCNSYYFINNIKHHCTKDKKKMISIIEFQ